MCKCKWGITIEKKRKNEFFSLVDKEDKLCGYIRLVDKEDKVLVGVGLKPCLCGQGLGNEVMEILKSQCDKMYKGRKIVLEVRSFNKRAIKCYEKAGFKVIDICSKKTLLGADEFVIMEL
ncbi:MAG: GNAT family N-acetyltransferase [Clostridium sp.]